MPRPQNSPKGLFSKNSFRIVDASGNAITLTANSTALLLDKGIRLNSAGYIRSNSTGFSFTAQAAKPSTRTAGYRWTFIQDSTGRCAIAVNTTGTTWKFLNVTSLIPT